MGSKNSNGRRKTLALLAATATLAGGLTAGTAYAGGGGGDQGGTGGGGSSAQFWAYKDDASGSWGSATDLNSVSRAMAARGVRMDDSAGKAAKALSDANAECVAGFRQRHPGEGDGDCRVVAVGAASGNGSTTSVWNGSGVYDAKIWKDNWYKYVAPNTYNYAGSQSYHTGDGFSDDPSNSVDKIMERHVDCDPQHRRDRARQIPARPAELHAERGHEGIRHDHQGRRHAERGGHGHHQP